MNACTSNKMTYFYQYNEMMDKTTNYGLKDFIK